MQQRSKFRLSLGLYGSMEVPKPRYPIVTWFFLKKKNGKMVAFSPVILATYVQNKKEGKKGTKDKDQNSIPVKAVPPKNLF